MVRGQSKVGREAENERASLDSRLSQFFHWNPFSEDSFKDTRPNNQLPCDTPTGGALICNSSTGYVYPLTSCCHNILVKPVNIGSNTEVEVSFSKSAVQFVFNLSLVQEQLKQNKAVGKIKLSLSLPWWYMHILIFHIVHCRDKKDSLEKVDVRYCVLHTN